MPPKRGGEIKIFITDYVDYIAVILLFHLTLINFEKSFQFKKKLLCNHKKINFKLRLI